MEGSEAKTLDTFQSLSNPPGTGKKVLIERNRGVYGIRVTRNIAHMIVPIENSEDRNEQILHILKILAKARVPIFLVKLHKLAVSFGLADYDLPRAEKALQTPKLEFINRSDLALVAIIASSMRDLSGVMVQISDALGRAGATLYETGDSHSSVQCLIEENRTDDAAQKLREAFSLSEEAIQEWPLTHTSVIA